MQKLQINKINNHKCVQYNVTVYKIWIALYETW